MVQGSEVAIMYSKIVITKNYFSSEWCDRVNNYMLENIDVNPNLGKYGVRKCKVRALTNSVPIYDDVFGRMMSYVNKQGPKLNIDFFNKIDGPIQHITYETGDGVGWHDDTIGNTSAKSFAENRKLSMTIMLSDPSEYTGGEFVFDPEAKIDLPVLEKGTVALFTSHSRHMVKEILSGRRNILFIFVLGPDWR